jgi:FkbM family methyltransferase
MLRTAKGWWLFMLSAVFNRLPEAVRSPLKRLRYRSQIRKGTFVSPEPDFRVLSNYLKAGDWAIDVGANVGHYTLRLSEIVGDTGRVIAFEPIPDTFKLLCANVRKANVTFMNAAASVTSAIACMSVPQGNAYRAAIGSGEIRVLCLCIDELQLPQRIALLKVDAEGHDSEVLKGAERTILRDRPVLIVESGDAEGWLGKRGYTCTRLDGSPNLIAVSQ